MNINLKKELFLFPHPKRYKYGLILIHDTNNNNGFLNKILQMESVCSNTVEFGKLFMNLEVTGK